MNLNARLTDRETQVAEIIAWGGSRKEVAGHLGIKTMTVANHQRNIYEKAEVRSLNQLAAWWFCAKHGISTTLNPLAPVIALLMFFITLADQLTPGNDMIRTQKTAKVRRKRKDDSKTNSLVPII